MATHHPSDPDVFIPHRRLRSGHLQTIASIFLRRENGLPASEERLFQIEDGVQLLCHCNWQRRRQETLTVIIVHGLEGSIQSQYMIGLGTKAWREGWNVVRMNMRNCGGTEQLAPTLYHSGMSGDVGAVARTLIEQEGLKRIALAGYSMGGNLVLKLAGEWGRDGATPSQVVAVAGVSPAMDLGASSDALNTPRNRIYELHFMRGLRSRFRRKAALFPDRYELARLNRRVWSVREFDDKITAYYCGFTGADDYYTRASSARVAEHINVPTLVLNAKDDPFIRVLPETRAKLMANPHIQFVETEHGGHCAFIAEANGYDGRWAELQVMRFFRGNLKIHHRDAESTETDQLQGAADERGSESGGEFGRREHREGSTSCSRG